MAKDDWTAQEMTTYRPISHMVGTNMDGNHAIIFTMADGSRVAVHMPGGVARALIRDLSTTLAAPESTKSQQ